MFDHLFPSPYPGQAPRCAGRRCSRVVSDALSSTRRQPAQPFNQGSASVPDRNRVEGSSEPKDGDRQTNSSGTPSARSPAHSRVALGQSWIEGNAICRGAGWPLNELHAFDVDDYIRYCSGIGWSRRTMNSVAKILRMFFRFAAGRGWTRRGLD